jgi:multidrug resistance efflux pump
LYEVVTTCVVVCRDAYVTADIVFIAPEVSGPMPARQVSDDQQVSKGTLLFSIDPQPFQIELDSRNAALNLAKANLTRAQDRLALTGSDIEAKAPGLTSRAPSERSPRSGARFLEGVIPG